MTGAPPDFSMSQLHCNTLSLNRKRFFLKKETIFRPAKEAYKVPFGRDMGISGAVLRKQQAKYCP